MKDEPLGNPIPVRLWRRDLDEIRKIANLLDMDESELIRRLVASGVIVLKGQNYSPRFLFPKVNTSKSVQYSDMLDDPSTLHEGPHKLKKTKG